MVYLIENFMGLVMFVKRRNLDVVRVKKPGGVQTRF